MHNGVPSGEGSTLKKTATKKAQNNKIGNILKHLRAGSINIITQPR